MVTDRSVALIAVLSLVTLTTGKATSKPGKKSQVCQTENCKEEAQRTMSFMNAKADPCADFYMFACGNFGKMMPIPKGQTNTDVFTDESKKINRVEEDSLLRSNKLLKSVSSAVRGLKKSFDACLKGPRPKGKVGGMRTLASDEKEEEDYLNHLRTEVLVMKLRQQHELLEVEGLDPNITALLIPDVLTPTSKLVDELSKMAKIDLCTQKEIGTHPVPLLRLFVDKFNPPLKTAVEKNLLNKVVDTIDTTLKIPGTTSALMDKLKKTVSSLTRNFVYPKFILNNTLLNKVKKIPWPLSPFTTNAAYSYKSNSLTVPAAFLGPTMFNLDVTPVLNFARAGWVVSHESGHLLAGIFNVTDHFKSGISCLVDQLMSLKNPQVNLAYNKVGALDVVPEILADVGAINISMLALNTVKNPTKLPGPLEKLTKNQLYFLTRAQILCENGEASYMKSTITDPAKVTQNHPNNYYRVNLPSLNSPIFAKAFKCKPGTPMNPAKKCSLW